MSIELDKECRIQLENGMQALKINSDQKQIELLLDYLQLLVLWNKSFNLTALHDPLEMVSRHLIDSLSVLPCLDKEKMNAETVIDIGTGAGLPGIVLAIMQPQLKIHLLDSNAKKTRFLFQVKLALKLDNIFIINQRAEAFSSETGFDLIITRAFASLDKTLQLTSHLAHVNTTWLAMKGTMPDNELAQVNDQNYSIKTPIIQLPDSTAKRHLAIIRQITSS